MAKQLKPRSGTQRVRSDTEPSLARKFPLRPVQFDFRSYRFLCSEKFCQAQKNFKKKLTKNSRPEDIVYKVYDIAKHLTYENILLFPIVLFVLFPIVLFVLLEVLPWSSRSVISVGYNQTSYI